MTLEADRRDRLTSRHFSAPESRWLYGARREVSQGRRATAVRARLSTPASGLTPDSGLTPASRLPTRARAGAALAVLTPRHLALRALIACAEKCRSVSDPDADAAVLLARGIAQINWRRPDDFSFGMALEAD